MRRCKCSRCRSGLRRARNEITIQLIALEPRSMSTEYAFDPTTGQVVGHLPLRLRSIDLNNGDEMTREEFHRIYEDTPEDFKAELIGGVVYVASPVRISHGQPHGLLAALYAAYASRTEGVEFCDNTTVFLGVDSEVQPDLLLRILPACGGQSTTSEDDYIVGPPEFVSEIALSSRAVDLNTKKRKYAQYGVREYFVWCAKENALRWFDLASGTELQPDTNGIYRVHAFPGLWINGPALLTHDHAAMMQTLEAGLAMPEHAAFVEELARRRASK